MSTAAPPAPAGTPATANGLSEAVREWWTNVRSGQLGSLLGSHGTQGGR
jgi:hypothetical protein